MTRAIGIEQIMVLSRDTSKKQQDGLKSLAVYKFERFLGESRILGEDTCSLRVNNCFSPTKENNKYSVVGG